MCDLWMEPTHDSGDYTLPILEEKGFKFWWPCQSREIDGDPASRSAEQINKIIQLRTQNIKTVYTSRL